MVAVGDFDELERRNKFATERKRFFFGGCAVSNVGGDAGRTMLWRSLGMIKRKLRTLLNYKLLIEVWIITTYLKAQNEYNMTMQQTFLKT